MSAQDDAFISDSQETPEPETTEETPKTDATEETEQEKYSKRVQKRIDKEVYEKNELRRRIETLEAQLSAPPAVKTLPNGAPDPDSFAAGRYDPDYLEALTDFKVQIALDNVRKQSTVAENEKRVQKLITEAVEKYPDYEDVTEEFTSHPLANVKEFTNLVMESDNPVELAYYLGKNPGELNKLAEMTLAQATRYMGRIEAQLNTTPKTLESVKRVSNAPAPITTIKSASVTNSKDPEKMSMSEYEAYRKKQTG